MKHIIKQLLKILLLLVSLVLGYILLIYLIYGKSIGCLCIDDDATEKDIIYMKYIQEVKIVNNLIKSKKYINIDIDKNICQEIKNYNILCLNKPNKALYLHGIIKLQNKKYTDKELYPVNINAIKKVQKENCNKSVIDKAKDIHKKYCKTI